MSVTRSAISAIGKGPCRALLQPHGFRYQAAHFWRATGDLYQAVHFQASSWGSRAEGRFTVNLGVTWPELFEGFTGRAFPANPGTALWPISQRIGGLRPERRDHWWDVAESSNIATLGKDVETALRDYGIPFLEGLNTRAQVLEAVRRGDRPLGLVSAQVPLILAIAAVANEDRHEAETLLATCLREHRGQPFEATVRRVATRLNIKPKGA